MKNFGKFKANLEVIEVEDPVQGTQQYRAYFFRDEDGNDIVDVAKKNPHKFYIAVDENNVIISMTDDIEHSQIEGYDIIGIDENYGYTFGQGGNVYGKVWTGTGIVAPESLLTEEEKRQQMPPLARVDFRLRLKKYGITTDVINKAVASIQNDDLREDYEIIWEDAQTFNRLDPFVINVFEYAGINPEQADIIWES